MDLSSIGLTSPTTLNDVINNFIDRINGSGSFLFLCNQGTLSEKITDLPAGYGLLTIWAITGRVALFYQINDKIWLLVGNTADIINKEADDLTIVPYPRNNLTASSYTDGEVLSAYQGYLLNQNKAPKSHASTNTTYGVGTGSNYGHCKTINNLTRSSFTNGEALSAYQGYLLNQKSTYITPTIHFNRGDNNTHTAGSVVFECGLGQVSGLFNAGDILVFFTLIFNQASSSLSTNGCYYRQLANIRGSNASAIGGMWAIHNSGNSYRIKIGLSGDYAKELRSANYTFLCPSDSITITNVYTSN